ncbi:hypothetical protein D3C72_1625330 [compost metagenome]
MAAVANQVSDIGISFTAELSAVVVDAELDLQLLARLSRHIVNNDPLLLRRDGRDGYRRYAGIMVRYAAKGFGRQFSQCR